MAYQRVTLSQLRTQLDDLLKTQGNFWVQEEKDAAINEAISVWQLMTGETVTTITQSVTDTAANLVALVTTDTAGKVLSLLRVSDSSDVPLREMSVVELDQGYNAWRTETASNTTQRPEYWAPVGIGSILIYPRVGATATYNLHIYSESVPLIATNSYIDIDEGHLTRVLAYAQSLLAFKQGLAEGTDNSKPLKELFITAAQERNRVLTETALYKNYMGALEDQGEPAKPAPQLGARG